MLTDIFYGPCEFNSFHFHTTRKKGRKKSFFFLISASESSTFENSEEAATNYLANVFEPQATLWAKKTSEAEWNYETDLLNETVRKIWEQTSFEAASFGKHAWENVKRFDYKGFKNEDVKRQLQKLSVIGVAALPEEKLRERQKISAEMAAIYSTAKICPFEKQSCDLETEGLALDPDLEQLMAEGRNYDELAYVWTTWRNATGPKLREMYNRFVDLGNEAAKLNGFDSLVGLWLRRYESNTFEKDCDDLWNQVKPLYEELHAYTRYKLRESRYPQLNLEDAIPASVLGNMWAQNWEGLSDLLMPFPNATHFDVSRQLQNRFKPDLEGIKGMFETANEFFVSMGLLNMSVAYGPKAMLVKPTDKQVVCHAGAWDFSNDDFRIKMCTTISQSDFLTAGHELGHIQYFMSYKHLPYMFRSGANPGFHEAIGDLISISMRTPKHMVRTGLVNEKEARVSKESTLNYLMQVSLQKVPFLPFAYLIDAYRWKIFDGSISRKDLTYEWTKIRSDYQGVIPPVVRTELDFDAAAKYHLPNDVPYISYFVSHMLQFQLYKALCETAKEYPAQHLHECDFYQNKDVGAQLQKLLKAGSSKNWQTILEETIGQSKMNASALLEFFAPIYEFLKEYRDKMDYPIGWPKKTFENMVHRG